MTRLKPWDRQPGESDPAWAAFQIYRDLGLERSTEKVRVNTGKNRRLIEGWSSKNSWVARVRAWDREQDREIQRTVKARRRKAAIDNLDLADTAGDIIGGRWQHWADDEEHEFTPMETVRLAEAKVRLEAHVLLATGGSAEEAAESEIDDIDIDNLTDEEILAYQLAMYRELTEVLDEFERVGVLEPGWRRDPQTAMHAVLAD